MLTIVISEWKIPLWLTWKHVYILTDVHSHYCTIAMKHTVQYSDLGETEWASGIIILISTHKTNITISGNVSSENSGKRCMTHMHLECSYQCTGWSQGETGCCWLTTSGLCSTPWRNIIHQFHSQPLVLSCAVKVGCTVASGSLTLERCRCNQTHQISPAVWFPSLLKI